MNNTVEIEYEKGKIPYYTKRMLAETDDKVFLPMSFVETEYGERVIYNISDMKSLADFTHIDAGECYGYLEQIIRLIHQAEEYLIEPDQYTLSAQTIFVGEKGKVCLLYSPNSNGSCKLDKLLAEILEINPTPTLAEYIENTIIYMKSNPSDAKLLSHIEAIRREIRISGIS